MHNQKLVKTRKKHHCVGCGFIFPENVYLFKRSGVFDGEFYHDYMCKICDDFLAAQDQRDWEYFGQSEVYWEGWHKSHDGGAFIADWLSKNKPICVEWAGGWRKPKGEDYQYKN